MPKRAGGGRRRVRIIPESRLPRFHAALMQLPRVQRDYLQVLLYTGARRGETAALQWRDIDLEERVIRLRAETTKAKRAAIIPMSSQLHALFVARRALGDRSVFVFPSERRSRTGHLTETNAFGQIAKLSGVQISAHDLRRQFISTAESCEGVSFAAIKRLVNHSMPGDTTLGYVVLSLPTLRAQTQRISDRLDALMQVQPLPEDVVKLG